MSGIVNLGTARAERERDNRLQTPVDMLQDAANDFGCAMPTGAMVLHIIRDDDGSFNIGWHASNLSMMEMISLMECVKATLLRDLGCTC